MSDSGQNPGHTPRRAPKRQEWLPNRMFDPVNNPFAIQNLLERQRREEESSFMPVADERPAFDYAGNPLLRNEAVLPPKSFASNTLLDAELPRVRDFQAEYEDEELASAVSAFSPERDAHGAETSDAETAVSDDDDHALNAANQSPDESAESPQPQPEPQQPLAQAMPVEADASTDSLAPSTEHAQDLAREAVNVAEATEANADNAAGAIAAEPATEQATEQATDAADEIANAELPVAQAAADEPSDSALAAPADAADVADTSSEAASADASAEAIHTTNADITAEAASPEAATAEVSAESVANMQDGMQVDAAEGDANVHIASDVSPDADFVSNADADAAPAGTPDLSSEAVTRLVEAAREEARKAALEEAREQSRNEVNEAREQSRNEVNEAREAAYQEGLEAGIAQAQAELQQSFDDRLAVMNQLIDSLQQLGKDPDTLFEPLKKLAMHLAEQLVRGELAQSAQTISRLVDNCLRELAASGEKAVIVHLNPEDLELYKPTIAQFGDSIMLRPDALLSRGSVRASLDGSVVEDLIERRVQGLKKSLAQPVAPGWRPSVPNPLTQRPQQTKAEPPKPAASATTATTAATAATAATATAAAEEAADSDVAVEDTEMSATEASADGDAIPDAAADITPTGRGPLS